MQIDVFSAGRANHSFRSGSYLFFSRFGLDGSVSRKIPACLNPLYCVVTAEDGALSRVWLANTFKLLSVKLETSTDPVRIPFPILPSGFLHPYQHTHISNTGLPLWPEEGRWELSDWFAVWMGWGFFLHWNSVTHSVWCFSAGPDSRSTSCDCGLCPAWLCTFTVLSHVCYNIYFNIHFVVVFCCDIY